MIATIVAAGEESCRLPLFIDRMPIYRRQRGRRQYWSVSLPITLGECDSPAPPTARVQRWVFDSGQEGEAKCLRSDLEAAGLDLAVGQLSALQLSTATGERVVLPAREADLWLFSNVPCLQRSPFRLRLDRGIAYQDVQRSHPEKMPRLIGMQVFRRARLQIRLDFAHSHFSVWTPGTLAADCAVFCRRALSGFSTVPISW